MARIRLARYVGVAPDWFESVHPAWEDAAVIAQKLDAKLARGPEIEPWTPPQSPGKPQHLH